MRFILAFVALILGAVCFTTGIAQRTILVPDPQVTAIAHIPTSANYAVISSSSLNAHSGQPTVTVTGSGKVFAAYGTNANVTAWLHGQRYAQVQINDTATQAKLRTAPAVANVASDTVMNPANSDLWLDQRSANRNLTWQLSLSDDTSLIIANDGTTAAPGHISVTWPVSTKMPYALPLMWGGGLLLLIGLLLYGAALLSMRRDAQGGRRNRMALLAPIAALALLGSSVGITPAQATPTAVKASTPPASLTAVQAERIVAQAGAVAAQADSTMDPKLLATRVTGPALTLRTAAYTLKQKLSSAQLPEAFPASSVTRVLVPEATAAWPRLLFAVVEPTDKKLAPMALTLMQPSPRAAYQISSAVQLQPNTALPALPALDKGMTRITNTTPLLLLQPQNLAASYGYLLRNTSSGDAKAYDTSTDNLYAEVGPAVKKSLAQQIGSTADITFSDNTPDPANTISIGTAQPGAIVSTYVEEQWQVKPNRKGVTVKPSGQTQALSGVKSTAKGIASTYGYQLLFSIPSVGSKAKIELLGFSQGLLDAKEL